MKDYRDKSKEELIHLLEMRDSARIKSKEKEAEFNAIISQILILLFNEKNKPIDKSLKLLLDYFHADWGYIALFEDEKECMSYPCEVLSDWATNDNDDNDEMPYSSLPWIVSQVKAKKNIVCCDFDSLPEEASVDLKLLKAQKLTAMLIIPLVFQNIAQGFIGFDFVRTPHQWTSREIADLHIVANIFALLIERKQVFNALEESRKRIAELGTKFKIFFDNMPVGVELYDNDGWLIDANDMDTNIFGVDKESLIGINLFENPNFTEEIKENVKKCKGGISLNLKYKFSKVQESGYFDTDILSDDIKHIQARGMRLHDPEFGEIGYLFIISDVTEIIVTAELLKNNLATVKAILLNGRSLIGEFDKEKDGIYIDPKLNDNLSSCSLSKFVQNNWMSFAEMRKYSCFKETEQWENSLFCQMLRGETDKCTCICHFTMGDQETWIRMNSVAHEGINENNPGKIICYLTDITEEKLLEEKLRLSQEESRHAELEMLKAQEADKLKSAFLANMSHEIRTPLNAIVGFSTLLLETEDKDEKEMFAEIISKNNDLLLRLITDILDFSKIEAGTLEYNLGMTDIKEILFGLYQIHSFKMPEEVVLICDLNSLPAISIYTDPKRITQVISNFISNAIKFTSHGNIALSYHKTEDNQVKVEVSDTGIGIEKDKIRTIFNRFVKLNTFHQGTGLGLTICKTIIEALGGKIGVESTYGKGSCFWFTLPINKEEKL